MPSYLCNGVIFKRGTFLREMKITSHEKMSTFTVVVLSIRCYILIQELLIVAYTFL